MPNSPRQHLCNLSRDELAQWCVAAGERPYRAGQIHHWLFHKRVAGFDEMRDLPAALRQRLADDFDFFTARIVQHQVAGDRTEKLLLELGDLQHIECVLMREASRESLGGRGAGKDDKPSLTNASGAAPSPSATSLAPEIHDPQTFPKNTERRTVCISTQVGCAMGCVFCASGLLGLKRNLSTGEILEQVLRLDRLLQPGEKITNVVVMGIGEPLANLKNLLPALDLLNDDKGLGLGARRITVSTVGLPDRIREFAATGRQYNLAISLHAPNNALRNALVPVNDRIGIDAILQAADDFFETTGRRVTYEYVLLAGVNDETLHARQLASLLSRRNAHVNLIPMNDVAQLPFAEPAQPRTRQFVEILEQAGVAATVRKRKGADIDAACGQLRLLQESETHSGARNSSGSKFTSAPSRNIR